MKVLPMVLDEQKNKPGITITSVFGNANIEITDGVNSIGVMVNQNGVKSLVDELQAILGIDSTEGDPVGWTIVAIGNDGSVLCESKGKGRRRYWFNES